ncbi:general stress protein [Agrococcus casei]|uniref:general stress protein n=1 Tax=Agrococcus casei TaxID=343512 RepID=UPI003F8DC08F
MTMIPARGSTRMPEGASVATFRNYDEAQGAVNKLAEADVNVKGVAIVGTELRLVERVVARLTYGRVALAGAMRGLYFGVFLGVVFWLLVPEAGLTIIAMPALGIAFGMLLGVVTHSLTRKSREFQSVQQVLPAKFELIVPHEVAIDAKRVLGPNFNATPPVQQTPPQQVPQQQTPPQQQMPPTQQPPSAHPAPPAQPSPPAQADPASGRPSAPQQPPVDQPPVEQPSGDRPAGEAPADQPRSN